MSSVVLFNEAQGVVETMASSHTAALAALDRALADEGPVKDKVDAVVKDVSGLRAQLASKLSDEEALRSELSPLSATVASCRRDVATNAAALASSREEAQRLRDLVIKEFAASLVSGVWVRA